MKQENSVVKLGILAVHGGEDVNCTTLVVIYILVVLALLACATAQLYWFFSDFFS